MVLDPDLSPQALVLESLDPGGTFEDLRAELRTTGGEAEVGRVQDGFEPCAQRYGSLGTDAAFACVVFETAVEPGQSYELIVSSLDRPTARAQTSVPESFSIVSLSLEGEPPGTNGVDAHWHRNPSAYGYFAFLRAESTSCVDVRGCSDGWFITTKDTAVTSTISHEALEEGEGPWTFEVLGLDRGLYEYLTSGTGNDLFSVPPVENVEGGHGVLGSWVRATRRSASWPARFEPIETI